ncbi:MAG TPA: DUF4349 domain-containing protein [Pyrinomonadaceae bacterium]|nr:DUF4349 domain-containing protein [Pyrinomonadaceae bacterium]
MKSPTIALFVLSVLILGSVSCGSARTEQATMRAKQDVANAPAAQSAELQMEKVSLSDSEKAAEQVSAAIDRKIIRNADLTIEVTSPAETQSKVVSIAEAHGGFVVNSEAKQRDTGDASNRTLDIKLVVRIPENQFGVVLDKVRGLANNRNEEKVTGQDVTEEFIDLEARIKTQRALEAQFLQIMKQAGNIEDALEVQRQIAGVRTEIEKLEGRKRFLENRSSLSTITVNILAPKPIAVNTTGFGRSVRDAVSESVDVGSGIVLFFVRLVIVMIPISVLLLLPGGLLVRYFIQRIKRERLAQTLMGPTPEGAP